MNAILQTLRLRQKHASFKKHKTPIHLNKVSIYVARILLDKTDLPQFREHKLGNSMPCENCQKYLKRYNVAKIMYTDVVNGIEVLCQLSLK